MFFDFIFERIHEFETIVVEKLDSVVFERVVRGGYDDTGRRVGRFGQICDCGRRQYADANDVAAHRHESGADSLLQHIAGNPGILPNQEFRLSTLDPATQHMARRNAQRKSQFACQLLVRNTPYSIGSKSLPI
jgi:hypothetical protein